PRTLHIRLGREHVAEGHFFPKTFRLVGRNARTTDLTIQQAAGSQSIVAYHFGGQAETGTSSQEAIFRVFFDELRCDVGRLPVSRRGDNESLHPFDVPSTLDKFCSEPVQQLGMDWGFALRTKVFRRLHDPVSENHLPIAIDSDARGERMRRIAQPASQREPVRWNAGRQWRKTGRNPRQDFLALISVVTPP